jgi:Protein of unknown function (DUF3237)
VRLEHLFDGELRFNEEAGVHVPTYGADSDWIGYVDGGGTIEGERLRGTLRWTNHPRRREDGIWLPDFQGVINTHDGAQILFSFTGYNYSLTERFEYTHRAVLAAITFRTSNDAYRWLNDVFGVLEAEAGEADEGRRDIELWRIRVYACIFELTDGSVR